MARMVRIVLAGQPHHVVQRSNNRQEVCFLFTTAVPWSRDRMVIVYYPNSRPTGANPTSDRQPSPVRLVAPYALAGQIPLDVLKKELFSCCMPGHGVLHCAFSLLDGAGQAERVSFVFAHPLISYIPHRALIGWPIRVHRLRGATSSDTH